MQDRRTSVYELIVVAVAAGAALTVIAGAAGLPAPVFDVLGSGAFPTAVAAIVLALCAGVAVSAFSRLRSARPRAAATARQAEAMPARGTPDWWPACRVAGIAVLAVAMALVFEFRLIGFGHAAAFFLFAGFLLLGARSGRRLWIGAALALVAAYGIAFVFTDIVYVDLP